MKTALKSRVEQLDPQIVAFLTGLESQGGPPLYTLSSTEARNVLLSLQRSVSPPLPAVDVEQRTLPCEPTGTVSLQIIRPQGAQGALPGVIYFHGGGWVLGDIETHRHLVSHIATRAQATVLFVDYNRSPEAQYPTAIEQAYAATKWIAENRSAVGVDNSHLAVAGDSAGGNMATVTCLLAKERGGPHIDFQVLCYPVTDARFDTSSYQQFGDDGYWLTRQAMIWFWDSYAPSSQRNEITASPLRASLEQLRGLPPALVTTNENDVLRDEGEAYAHKLMQAGVPVIATRYLGAIHDLLLLHPIVRTPVALAALEQVCDTLRTIFAQPSQA
uniref:Esterase n=1 Tax=Thermosporothrix sp. COM3 TaxID=2490863 RepID=A0A455SKM4_9CHLR|nr:esterase [Thermosporothrix sp. COM3]